MKNSLYQTILVNMRKKSTEDLTKILKKNDNSEYSDDAFEAIKQVLSERENKITNLKTIEKIGNDKKLEELINFSFDTNHSDDERNEAAKVIKKLQSPEAVDILLVKLKDKSISYEERVNIIKTLGIVASPISVEQLSIEIENNDKAITEHALNALKEINDDKSKKAIEPLSCQVCSDTFYTGREKKTLCPICNRLNKISGWLAVLCFGWLFGSLYFCYNLFQIIIVEKIGTQFYSTNYGYVYTFYGILMVIGLLLLILKMPIAKGYIIMLLIASLFLNYYIAGSFNASLYPNFIVILWLAYFIRSQRVKIVYRKKAPLEIG